MKHLVIMGGGFGGLSAARYLSRYRDEVAVTVIDRKNTSDFLPLLPDVVGGRLPSSAVSVNLHDVARRLGFAFVRAEVRRIDPSRRCVLGEGREVPYDALIMAAGSEPNYFGNQAARQAALPLNTARDAGLLAQKLQEGRFKTCVIIGGGYTGVEIATHVWRRLRAAREAKAIVIVEAASSILGALPDWMKRYTLKTLDTLQIAHFENCRLAGIDNGGVRLSNGRVFNPALLVWAAGVQAPACVRSSPFARGAQERIRVDAFLRARDDVFVIGDAAAVMARGHPLRMSVQFAIAQGACAAANALRHLRGARLRPYRPLDPGFVLPMAHGRSCGTVLGVRVRGRLPTFLHYGMCAWRLPGLAQKIKMCKLAVQSERVS
ncbi:MAG: FAD-dependent oxidoreductase [Kiritimatiellae bacterium]|nr:FAD-dependent oxidoreductase [Kiritimatiellia bacterium]